MSGYVQRIMRLGVQRNTSMEMIRWMARAIGKEALDLSRLQRQIEGAMT